MSRCAQCDRRIDDGVDCPKCDAVVCSERCLKTHSRDNHTKKASRVPLYGALGCGVLLFSCCGFGTITTMLANSRAKAQIAEADQLWADGKRAEAVEKYAANYERADDKPQLLRRVVEFRLESGDTAEAKKWLARGISDKVEVVYEGKAKEEFAALRQELADDEAKARSKKEADARAEQERAAAAKREKEEKAKRDRASAALLAEEEFGDDNLVLLRKTVQGDKNEFSTSIKGTVVNRREKRVRNVQITFDVYDASGGKVGTASDAIDGLNPGEQWSFNALYLGTKCTQYRISKLVGR